MEILFLILGLIAGFAIGAVVTFYAFRAYQMRLMKQLMQPQGGQLDLGAMLNEVEKMMKQ